MCLRSGDFRVSYIARVGLARKPPVSRSPARVDSRPRILGVAPPADTSSRTMPIGLRFSEKFD